jgi:hypothetical protein
MDNDYDEIEFYKYEDELNDYIDRQADLKCEYDEKVRDILEQIEYCQHIARNLNKLIFNKPNRINKIKKLKSCIDDIVKKFERFDRKDLELIIFGICNYKSKSIYNVFRHIFCNFFNDMQKKHYFSKKIQRKIDSCNIVAKC